MEIIQNNWWAIFKTELTGAQELKIVSPFISENLVRLLKSNWNGKKIQVITRFNLNDFRTGVSSLEALKTLINMGAEIKGIKDLHSKAYIFDSKSVIITSANFTNGGFFNNYEFGVRSDETVKVHEAKQYFKRLWLFDSNVLSNQTINEWESVIAESKVFTMQNDLADYGKSIVNTIIGQKKYFVKFYGQNNVRANLFKKVIDEVSESHCHFAITFSEESGVPKRYNEGDIVYIARMIEGSDYAIFGRAIAKKHIRGVDEASDEDIIQVPWKSDFPIYIRVHSPEFLNTEFANCPKLRTLMSELDFASFQSTQKRHNNGEQDINPANVLMRKADVILGDDGAIWIEKKFVEAKNQYGTIPQNYIDNLYQGTPKI